MAEIDFSAAAHEVAGHRPLVIDAILRETLYWYGIVLLAAFVGTAGAQSIMMARSDEDIGRSTRRGPGGKPLPVTKKKKRDSSDDDRFAGPNFGRTARRAFQGLSLIILGTFVANAAALATHTIRSLDWPFRGGDNGWWAPESMNVYIIGSSSLYLYLAITLFEWTKAPTMAHLLVWCLGFVGELIIFACLVARITWVVGYRAKLPGSTLSKPVDIDSYEIADLVIESMRLAALGGLVAIYMTIWATQACQVPPHKTEDDGSQSDADETTPLINGSSRGPSYSPHPRRGQEDNRKTNVNGTRNTNGGIEGYVSRDEEAAFYRPEKLPRKNWWEYIRGYSIFFQYIWPRDSLRLQFIVLVCFGLLLLQRIVNVMIPIQIGVVATKLGRKEPLSPETLFPLAALTLLIALRIVQGASGLLGSLRNLLWIPVGQYSYKALTTAAFEHVHSLSLDFHVTKRTGEVLSALNKGASINQFLEAVTFNVLPMILDLTIAIYYFYVAFDAVFATIVAVNTFWYLYLTVRMAQTRSDEKRKMTNADREEEAVKNDSIISYETVKYFNAEEYEFKRYRDAIKVYQDAEAKVLWGTHLMVIWQNLVFSSGLGVSLLIGGWQTWYGYRSVGNFLSLYAYLTQLQGPLNFFASFYKTTQQAMISGERLLELFKIQPTVVDAPGVKPLKQCDGYIRWNNVEFAYDPRSAALKNLNFECAPGTTTAFVGESGGGKSTLFRLMFRYYDCTNGSISIDGNNVKDLTIDSVRRYIGVVPQDTMMFNETLMYNLKYANPGVSDEEVYAACRAASIHDRIMTFADKYDTIVGDRGIRLSGGERQRVAIARTMLKNPKIIMLDEATSALDSQTEQHIQSRLENLSQGRTLLIIAHRLSTIVQADQIIVLHAGEIVEKGTHAELLQLKGRYFSMWEKQIRAEEAEKKAREANRKAKRLLKKANIAPNPKDADAQSDGYNSMASSATLLNSTSSGSKPLRREDSSGSSSDSDSSHSHSGDSDSSREREDRKRST